VSDADWERFDAAIRAESDRFFRALKWVREQERKIRLAHDKREAEIYKLRPVGPDGFTLRPRSPPEEVPA
jgi:hypothetical protein